MKRGDEFKDRTKAFALRVMNLIDALPKSTKGRAIANQLVRSEASGAANYRAACRARSQAEFIGTVEEETDETAFWLELIIDSKLMVAGKVRPLLTEANELIAIMAASYISAARTSSPRNNQHSAFRNQHSTL
ncbi:MAG: four helix bundle protein [Chthoniobacterales bacterium]